VRFFRMRFRDLLRNIDKYEQKLENALLYVDFLPDQTRPLILMKDGSLPVLFELGGLDYEGLPRRRSSSCAPRRKLTRFRNRHSTQESQKGRLGKRTVEGRLHYQAYDAKTCLPPALTIEILPGKPKPALFLPANEAR
jgi:hypothetical protein